MAVIAAGGDERAELVLFTTLELTREQVNQTLREAGFAPLHFIRRVERIESLPVLGTGKVDYRALAGRPKTT